ncbi:MAG: hypothetical protein IJW92_07600 [Clostridia bacterium]|nr:hypothetical protein [Clostridia bacterium]
MLALLDCRTPDEVEHTLLSHGHSVLRLPPHPCLDAPVASHPDMLLFFADGAIYCTKSYARLVPDLLQKISNSCRHPIQLIEQEYAPTYPGDILLNAVSVSTLLFCHPTGCANELRAHPAYTVCPVRQGYAKCAVIPVGEHALITADSSIASVASQRGLEVLTVSDQTIRLPGYGHGFVGGCASFAPYGGTDLIYFCGSAESYPEWSRMESFCRKHGKELYPLTDDIPLDIGTVFLLNESN